MRTNLIVLSLILAATARADGSVSAPSPRNKGNGIVSAGSVAAADLLYPPGERTFFKIKFIDTTAGECLFETLENTTWGGRSAHHFRATVTTIGLIGMIYPYKETVDLYYDREKRIPLYVDVNIKDRKKIQHTQIRLSGPGARGEEIEDSSEPGEEPKHRRKNWDATPGAQSLFSILHYLRGFDLKQGEQVSFAVSHDEKNATFAVDVTGTEKIKLAQEEKDALVLKVLPVFTKTVYPNVHEQPVLWVSNDSRKALLKFEFKHKLGKVFGVAQSSR